MVFFREVGSGVGQAMSFFTVQRGVSSFDATSEPQGVTTASRAGVLFHSFTTSIFPQNLAHFSPVVSTFSPRAAEGHGRDAVRAPDPL